MCDYIPLANGSITSVQGRSSPFTTNPISFQLFGESTGGPPTTSYWTRNGANITSDNTFSISSISFTGSHDDAGHRTAYYQSILTVTGRQPGMYIYYVSNRRTSGVRTSLVLVDGNYHYILVVNFSFYIIGMCNLNYKSYVFLHYNYPLTIQK